jgi:hypothetical protein
MPYWPPDTPPAEPPQMPAAPGAGPAPVPFTGDQTAGNAPLMTEPVSPHMPGVDVLSGVTGASHVSEAPLAAPNVNPYEAGSPSKIYTGGYADDVTGTVAAAVAAAEARAGAHQQAVLPAGSSIGTAMDLPAQDFSLPNAHQIGYVDG